MTPLDDEAEEARAAKELINYGVSFATTPQHSCTMKLLEIL
jgi:hypothetical protein